jgi:hypothetical protein
LVIVSSPVFAADKKQLADALAAVEANLKTSAGKQYDDGLSKPFAKYLPDIKHCKESAISSGAGVEPFDMFLKLNAEGKVLEALVYPETSIAICSRTALLAGKFDPPPHGDYWVNIHMELKH